jgi:hypothetical protein
MPAATFFTNNSSISTVLRSQRGEAFSLDCAPNR